MSSDWPRGWYSDEPDRPGAGGQRPEPSFTPNSPGPRGQRPPDSPGRGMYAPGSAAGGGRDAGGLGAGNGWPAQPPSRAWTGGGGGVGGGVGGGGYRPRGGRRWLRPRRGYNKLNAAYAFGGPKLLVQTVQNVTGLPVSHYMGIGFGGLVSVVNDVGGVRMCLPAPMKDPKAGLNLKAGCQTLNGDQALGFVRTRNFAISDLQREQDQRILIKGILSKMTSPGTL